MQVLRAQGAKDVFFLIHGYYDNDHRLLLDLDNPCVMCARVTIGYPFAGWLVVLCVCRLWRSFLPTTEHLVKGSQSILDDLWSKLLSRIRAMYLGKTPQISLAEN